MRQWLVDAFTQQAFGGNQACVLEPFAAWPEPHWMQRLAGENNVGATAFLCRTSQPHRFGLRWFTPSVEVPFCGHATLATAHILFAEEGMEADALEFETDAGLLCVSRCGSAYEMSLPSLPAVRLEAPPTGLAEALGREPSEVWTGHYVVALFEDAADVRTLEPNLPLLKSISDALGGQGNVGVAARAEASSSFDVVDRFFAPGYGIPEDPATGSFHCMLTPIFSEELGAAAIRFEQACPGRGAELEGFLEGERVLLRGAAMTIAEGRLRVAP